MKKFIITLLIMLSIAGLANAQIFNRDSFINGDSEENYFGRSFAPVTTITTITPLDPSLPGGHGWGYDIPAPLGSGLIILSALGAGYATAKRRKEVEK